jgi:spore coat polysaccharide biosynthesis protein SpsF
MGGVRRVVGIVQARMGSTRLPGKSMASIAGKPLLQRVVERCRASRSMHELWVATTTEGEDEAIVRLCQQIEVLVLRGSVDDVLDRYYRTALASGADVIVRITADDPFKDPQVIDQIVCRLLDDGLDYGSNTVEPTYPEGLDIEAFTFAALTTAWREARLSSEREHVTPYLWKNPHRFRLGSLRLDVDLSHHRWTVDYEQDLTFVRAVYDRLGPDRLFLMRDVLALIESEPGLLAIGRGVARNQGYLKSLAQDVSGTVDRT